MSIVNVVLSGGVGSRLWPLSRKSKPKQYLPIFGGKSLFELTVERNSEFCEELLVVGSKENYILSRETLKNRETPYKELIEATPRNTAAAIAFAAFAVKEDDILLVSPSDHLINGGEAYHASLDKAFELARKGNLVTFGLVPKSPETGFGYIEFKGNDVISFREKPEKHTAQDFLSSGNFLWNSGMFCFSAGLYLSELEKYEPEVFEASFAAFSKQKDGFLPYEESVKIPSISVDYAVMERSKRIKVVESEFEWSDMGSFEALYDYLGSIGHTGKKGTNLYIGGDKHVEFLGLDQVIVVEAEDSLLVLHKSAAQDVKKIYQRLESDNPGLLQ